MPRTTPLRATRLATRASPNWDRRPSQTPPSLLILHYTGMASATSAIARLCDPSAKVSAHYLVDEDGAIACLVAEEYRAWHAGRSGWDGIDDVNGHSVGIELVNPGHEWGYRPFPDAQIEALVALSTAIVARHRMRPSAVLGHSDVAPARKTDPGELFPWPYLARRGLGLWPEVVAPRAADRPAALALLASIGYRLDLPDTVPRQVIAAFQRHWRPARVDGVLDDDTMARIAAVERLYAACRRAT